MRHSIFAAVSLLCLPVYGAIHLNQIGYYPDAPKIATVNDTGVKKLTLIDERNRHVAEIHATVKNGYYSGSEEFVSSFDFSRITRPGTYKIAAGNDTSCTFTIRDSLYMEPLRTMMKSFYYQRCSFALDWQYAGAWYREAGHPDQYLPIIEANTSLSNKSVQGGWYDAGDFGKYVVCAGITCGNMLGAYELCPEYLSDGTLNIPESQNGKSDILDEIRYELDWMIRMQDEDGGVFFKVGPVEWPWDIMPVEDWTDRFIIGKSTTSTLDFAAVMAMAGRIYRSYDSIFAEDCRNRAERAWEWAIANPRVRNPQNTYGTGPYADGNDLEYTDEFLWAAAELYITTQKNIYSDTLFTMIENTSVNGYAWWQDVKNLAFFSLSVNGRVLPADIRAYVNKSITDYADIMLDDIDSCSYLIPIKRENYYWGSNASAGNMANVLVYAYNIRHDPEYLEGLIYTTDYLFGRNPTGYSYVSGLGSFSPMYPAQRVSTADGIDDPVPGFVVGGANQSTDGADPVLTEIIEAMTPPAKCYADHRMSWASNEVSINQTSAWIPVLAFLEKHIDEYRLHSGRNHHGRHHHRFNDRLPFSYFIPLHGPYFCWNAQYSLWGQNWNCVYGWNNFNVNR